MIKKLQYRVCSCPNPCGRSHDVNSIDEVFPNIEQLTCSSFQADTCLFLFNNLPKLSKLSITFYQRTNDNKSFNEVKEELSKLKNIYFL